MVVFFFFFLNLCFFIPPFLASGSNIRFMGAQPTHDESLEDRVVILIGISLQLYDTFFMTMSDVNFCVTNINYLLVATMLEEQFRPPLIKKQTKYYPS